MTRVDGPWTHRDVAANGARFHVAELGTGPVVLLLHGFPEFWWAWRHQLPDLADAGFRAVAMDLRGYGSSDKTPRGYDPMNLAADVAGVIRTLGVRSAVVVGQGWGGYVGWATTAAHADCVTALCTVAAPHPAELLRTPARLASRAPIGHLAAMQVPWVPERRIRRSAYVARHLERWSSAASDFPSSDEIARYTEAFAEWPSPHCALEYHRWLVRSRLRADGRAFGRLMRPALDRTSPADRGRGRSGDQPHRRTPVGSSRRRRLRIAPGGRDRGRRPLPARGAAGRLQQNPARLVGVRWLSLSKPPARVSTAQPPIRQAAQSPVSTGDAAEPPSCAASDTWSAVRA